MKQNSKEAKYKITRAYITGLCFEHIALHKSETTIQLCF